MGGLIALVVLAGWVTACASASIWIMKRLAVARFRTLIAMLIFGAFAFLPVADELIARPQFNSLCKEGAWLRIDAKGIKGRLIRLDVSPSNEQIDGYLIPILHSHYSYRDTVTDEQLAWFDVYTAKGGVMARWTQFPEGGGPWTMESAVCVPPNEGKLSQQYGFTLIN